MPSKKPEPPARQEFVISAGLIKWAISIGGGLVVLIGGWFVIWDRVDTHWRLEQVQAAKDKEYAAEVKRLDNDVKAAREKAESDTKILAKKAETGRAWVLWGITDTKAYTASQFVRICHALKLPNEECARQEAEASAFRQEAADNKRTAQTTGQDK